MQKWEFENFEDKFYSMALSLFNKFGLKSDAELLKDLIQEMRIAVWKQEMIEHVPIGYYMRNAKYAGISFLLRWIRWNEISFSQLNLTSNDIFNKLSKNSQLRVIRDKYNIGTKNGRAKLSKKQVLRIRKLAKDGINLSEIAHQYKVSRATISAIINNHSYWDVGNKDFKRREKYRKLDINDVTEIRYLLKKNTKVKDIANRFKVSERHIRDIRRGVYWKT